ncbi:MAG: hypothetical protein DRP45_07280, partial [Candidatus Zixiibacteriota bacterium]
MNLVMVFQTSNLTVRRATISDLDVNLFYSLWTDPRVMTFVGFPQGLRITKDDIRASIDKADSGEYDKKMRVELKEAKQLIGERKL